MSVLSKQCIFTPTRKNTPARDTLEPFKISMIYTYWSYIDECERVEVERKFSITKRKCGMGMIVTRLKETTCRSIAMSVLLFNLRRIEKLKAEMLWVIIHSLKLGFVQ